MTVQQLKEICDHLIISGKGDYEVTDSKYTSFEEYIVYDEGSTIELIKSND